MFILPILIYFIEQYIVYAVLTWWSMILWLSVVLRRTVWEDPDTCFGQVVKTSVDVSSNSPSQDYVHFSKLWSNSWV